MADTAMRKGLLRNKENRELNLKKNEEELIKIALNNCNNNQIAVANALGIQRMALARKIQKYNISFTYYGS